MDRGGLATVTQMGFSCSQVGEGGNILLPYGERLGGLLIFHRDLAKEAVHGLVKAPIPEKMRVGTHSGFCPGRRVLAWQRKNINKERGAKCYNGKKTLRGQIF